MKVKELIEILKDCELESEVILQKDSEGNGYSPLSDVDDSCIYIPDSTWSGEVYSTLNSAEDNCMEEDDWEELKKQPRCVVLCPVN